MPGATYGEADSPSHEACMACVLLSVRHWRIWSPHRQQEPGPVSDGQEGMHETSIGARYVRRKEE